MKLRTVVAGCGASILLLLPYLALLLSPDHLTLYHSRLPDGNLAWGNLIYLATASLLAVLVLAVLDKWGADGVFGGVVWGAVAARLTYLVFSGVAAVRGQPIRHPRPTWIITAVFLVIVALPWLRPALYRQVRARMMDALVLSGLCMLWIVPVLLYQALRPITPDAAARLLPIDNRVLHDASDTPARVVWILFDELSYDQTFAQRFPGLAMPAFDRLKSESVLFTDVAPAGYYTELVIPSLLLGKTVDAVESDLNGFPSFRFAGQRGWQRLNPQNTLFAEAERDGWTTGVAGWFIPYCRILQGTLNSCYWKDSPEPDGASAEGSALAGAGAPLVAKWQRVAGESTPQGRDHEQAYVSLMPEAEALIRDERIRFLYIHLPLPHPTGIYDRKTASLRVGGSYIDNLALTDRALGELMSAVGKTALAGRTLVIVCSDHSWRTPMWKSAPGWTAEDQDASRGGFDPRPMLMMHYPGQTREIDEGQPFAGLRLHAILQGILRGDLASPGRLEAWLRSSAEPVPAGPAAAQPAALRRAPPPLR